LALPSGSAQPEGSITPKAAEPGLKPRLADVERIPDVAARSLNDDDYCRYHNQICIALDDLFKAACAGSDVAQDFIRAKAEEFVQVGGAVAQ